MIVVDNFAGGGGASLGIEQALGRPVDIAINHDAEAIAMHQANHPRTLHVQDDIWSVDPVEVTRGQRVRLAWFSPDCTHFSKAAGRKPRSQKIRGLAWVVIEWAAAVQPDVIMLENVEEFRTWGPLDADGYPIRERAGETFSAWREALEGLGYAVEFRELRAADYGAPTIRKRLFIIARRDGQRILWPEPSHGVASMLEPHLEPYRTAAECIDWSLPCPSIFERERALAEATERRIAAGIWRFVINDPAPFILNITHGGRLNAIDEPLRTITTAHRGEKALIRPYLATRGWGEREGQAPRVMDIAEPLGTVVGGGIKHALVAPSIVRMNHDGAGKPADSIADPLATVTTQHNKHQLVAAFLAKHYGGMVGVGVDTPLPTTLSRGAQNQLVTSNLVHLRGTGVARRPDEPLPTVTAGGNHIAEVRALLLKFYGTNRVGQSLREPMHTVTTKDRLGLVTVHGEDYVITDIGMRMLTPRELYRAQGFPEGYVIDPVVGGRRLPKTHQVRMCGNSVCPPVAHALVDANVGALGQQEMWRGYELALAAGEAAS